MSATVDRPRAHPARLPLLSAKTSLLCAVAVLADLPPALRAPAVILFYLTAPGALVMSWIRLPRALAAAVVTVGGMAVLFAQASVAVWTAQWGPVPGTALLALATLAAAAVRLVGLRRRRPAGDPLARPAAWDGAGRPSAGSWRGLFRRDKLRSELLRRSRAGAGLRRELWREMLRPARLRDALARRRPTTPTLVLLAVAAGLLGVWLALLPRVARAPVEGLGLLQAAPPAFAAVLVGVVVLFLAAVVHANVPGAAGALVVGMAVLRLTGPLTLDEPLYWWTYKHLGVVDAIQQLGTLLPGTDIYQEWPTMFAAMAWLSDVTGVAPLTLAAWTTPVVHVLLALAVAALARALGLTGLHLVTAVFLAEMVSWVGQDYFAPQSFAMILALTVVALACQARRSTPAAWLAVGLYACLVSTHQLTPFWVLALLGLLALTRQVRPWLFWTPALIAGAYLLSHWAIVDSYGVFSGLDVVANAQTREIAHPSRAQEVASTIARVAAVGLWLPVVAVLVWRAVRRRGRVLVPAIVALSPFLVLGGQNYGGEAILRVFLYSTAGCAIVLAPVLVDALHPARRATGRLRAPLQGARAAAAGLGALALIGVCSQAYFGSWFLYQVTPAQVEVAQELLDEVPPPAYISPATPHWPDRASAGYAGFVRWTPEFDRPAFDETLQGRTYTSEEDLAAFEDRLDGSPWPVYVTFGSTMDRMSRFAGLYPAGALDNLIRELPLRPGWEEVLRRDDVVVLRYLPAGTEAQPAALWSPR